MEVYDHAARPTEVHKSDESLPRHGREAHSPEGKAAVTGQDSQAPRQHE